VTMADSDYMRATGRRKSAAAQVRILPGSGLITVNSKEFAQYFPGEPLRGYVTQPLMITGTLDKYDIKVTVKGGGKMGQAAAMRHGLSRALVKSEPNCKGVLKESGMLTRDSRVKERKKPGQPGARKRFQFSKR
jgi:small subunit ribosomal protein S9